MNGKEQDYLIPFKHNSVKCCKCYVDYWKLMREKDNKNSFNCFKFDYSIEKVKSFRKYFQDDNTLFHFCIDCFKNVMITVPISLIEFEVRFRGGCIANALMGNESVENICNSCINFVIERFSKDDFIIV